MARISAGRTALYACACWGHMGFRFRRSLRIAPGLRLNFSKSGISTSIGGRGATYNIGPRGTRTTVGLPGTGLFWTSSSGRGSSASGEDSSFGDNSPSSSARAAGCGWVVALIALIAVIGMCSSKTPAPSTSTPTAAPQASTFYVKVRSANCRSAPASTASVVTGVSRGDSVLVSEQLGDWSHVTDGGRDCWISSDLLSSTTADVGLSPAEADTASRAAVAVPLVSSAAGAGGSSSRNRRHSQSSFDGDCPCSGSRVCIGPRGGRYCITSGGNKRYGV